MRWAGPASLVTVAMLVSGCTTPPDAQSSSSPPSATAPSPPTATASDAPAAAPDPTPSNCGAFLGRSMRLQVEQADALTPVHGQRDMRLPEGTASWEFATLLDDRRDAALTLEFFDTNGTRFATRTYPGPAFHEPYWWRDPPAGDYVVKWTAKGYLTWGLEDSLVVCEPREDGTTGPPYRFGFEMDQPDWPRYVCPDVPRFTRPLDWRRGNLTDVPTAAGNESFELPGGTVIAGIFPASRTMVGTWSMTVNGPDGLTVFKQDAISVHSNNAYPLSNPVYSPGPVAVIAIIPPSPGAYHYAWEVRGAFEKAEFPVRALVCDEASPF